MAGKKSKSGSSSRPYNHSLMSYAPLDVILNALEFHSEQILAWAFIHHDKFTEAEGQSEPHYHILIRTYSRHYSKAVCKWFWCVDENGPVNTFAEEAFTVSTAFAYLTHKYDVSKYQYSDDDVVCSDTKWFKVPDLAEADNLTVAYCLALLDTDPFLLVKRFGRDFIVHERNIYSLVERTKERAGRSPARRDELWQHLNEVDLK